MRESLQPRPTAVLRILVLLGAVVLLLFLVVSLLPPSPDSQNGLLEPERLSQEVERAREELKGVKFPTPEEAQDTITLLLAWASEHNVQIWSFSTTTRGERLGGGDYTVVEYSLDFRGPREGVIGFLERVHAGPMETSVMENLDVRAEGEQWFARMQLKMFTKA